LVQNYIDKFLIVLAIFIAKTEEIKNNTVYSNFGFFEFKLKEIKKRND
jgi:hypothetical protein